MRNFRCVRILYSIAVVSILLPLLLANIRLHHSPKLIGTSDSTMIDDDLLKGLRYLEGEMTDGLATRMQGYYPEGFVFANALYGLAWCNIAANAGADSALYLHAMNQARTAYRAIDSDEGRNVFTPALDPPYGVFYNGWRNVLLGEIVAARRESRPAEDSLFAVQCDAIADAFVRSSTPFLPSYPDQAWPADAVVAAASLAHHDRHFSPRYKAVLGRWRSLVEERLDAATGLIPHAVHSTNGFPLEGARGSSQSLMLCFLPLIDSGFGAAQYAGYREAFLTTWFGLPAVREYPHGVEGEGDVDSGPVLLSVGAAASVVGVGTLRTNGDVCRATEHVRTIDALGFPWSSSDERRYFFGLLPIGDIFLAWARSLPVGRMNGDEKRLQCSSSAFWGWPFHLLSALLVFVLCIPLYRMKRRRV